MGRINDTILINIDLAENTSESVLEVVTHIGTVRTVLNIFRGDHAELIYQTLINKHLVDPYSQLRAMQEEKYPPQKFLATDKDIILEEHQLIAQVNDIPEVKEEKPMTHLERITFKEEVDAKIVFTHILELFAHYGQLSLADFHDMVGIDSTVEHHLYICDDLEELAILQNDEGWYIYPLEFKKADVKQMLGIVSPSKHYRDMSNPSEEASND